MSNSSSYDRLAPIYRRASFEAKEQTGSARVKPEVAVRIAHDEGIGIGESAALAYLARNEVEEFIMDAEFEIERVIYGDAL